ncbi:hypothetical protein MES4922_30459 [Mesorhizobium ventifaucium]|uniref:Uncharacterized protein n=1 Tax=Mesorhizobium ventifaucium TaxID=666020 RepID=A0ABN8JYE4_9HYPH|nr:hypothetical protein MES4922_30459 [Mesorhizobium ventifaucium]
MSNILAGKSSGAARSFGGACSRFTPRMPPPLAEAGWYYREGLRATESRSLSPQMILKADADPAVAIVGARKVAGGDGIGESEQARVLAARIADLLHERFPFTIEHRLKPRPGHVRVPGP